LALAVSCLTAIASTPARTTRALGTPAGGQVTMSSAAPPVLGFVDISGTGLAMTGVGDDTSHGVVVVTGNALFPSGDALFGNNGVLIAGLLDGFIGYDNLPLPASGLPTGADLPAGGSTYLFPFWDDLLPNENLSPSNTTLYAQLVPGGAIFMWKNETHYSLQDDARVITFEIQIFTNPQTSCTPLIQFLYQDSFFGAGAPPNNGASATIGGVFPQGNAQFSFNSPSIQSGSCLSIFFLDASLTASSPFGPGSIQVDYAPNSCQPVSRFLGVTFNHGVFPNGWLFGLDIPFNQLAQELAFGPPFSGGGGPFTLGPFGGLPSGLTIHAVTLGFDAAGLLIGASDLLAYLIP
jgi:hypothetical protein